MRIELNFISVRDLVNGYKNSQEEGVVGYGGKLNIRPKYQREFVYNEKQKVAVIDTIQKGYPLNVMYWCENNDKTFEVLDGQQRTLSICSYIAGDFSKDKLYFNNLTKEEQDKILDYKLMVFVCSDGTEQEKLDWFKTINIAGEKLSEQELRNAVYTGEWLTSAKTYFSKTNCVAYQLANKYVKGVPIRQELLETAIDWLSKGNIEDYMSKHQHDPNANELWTYFRNIIEWVQMTFTTYRKEMKGINWGELYDTYKDQMFDTKQLEEEIKKLMADDEVTKKSGIYKYVLTRDEKYLSIRNFTDSQKRTAYERQNGVCAKCGKHFEIEETEPDHITPWSKGGKTELENCQILCVNCNRTKSDK